MKIYFEDGRMFTANTHGVPRYDFTISGRNGYSQNKMALDAILAEQNPNYVVYTNSLIALNNRYCWNNDLKVPELYLRAGDDNEFTRVDELTDRELREGHNIRALFENGGFYKANYPKGD